MNTIDPDNFRNELSWTDPRTTCGDFDLDGYRIYYAPTENEDLQLIQEISNPNVLEFTHSELSTLAGCYAVTAYDTFGNESSRGNKTCLDNCPLYKLPNAFTPNGDGQNDLFTPILPYYFVDHIQIKIFNRWGNVVYQTNDPDINWDGTDFKTGEPVPEGTYQYICEVFEVRVSGVVRQPEPLSGYIQLVRN
jgi:gliding motility-associated-like protein